MRLRLFGREELPAHLSAELPAAAHTHTHWRGPTRSRNINTSTRSCTYQTKHVYEPSKGFFSGISSLLLFLSIFFSLLLFKSFILHRCARLHPTAVAALLSSGHTLPPHSVLLISREVVGSNSHVWGTSRVWSSSAHHPETGVDWPTVKRECGLSALTVSSSLKKACVCVCIFCTHQQPLPAR